MTTEMWKMMREEMLEALEGTSDSPTIREEALAQADDVVRLWWTGWEEE